WEGLVGVAPGDVAHRQRQPRGWGDLGVLPMPVDRASVREGTDRVTCPADAYVHRERLQRHGQGLGAKPPGEVLWPRPCGPHELAWGREGAGDGQSVSHWCAPWVWVVAEAFPGSC